MANWTEWHDGFPPVDLMGDVHIHTVRTSGMAITQYRWVRYKHETAILSLLAGKLRLIPSKSGPERPKETEA